MVPSMLSHILSLCTALLSHLKSNTTYYTFANIQYATATRFSPPRYPPPVNRRNISDGSQESICPQAYPAWQFSMISFLGGENLSNATTEQLLNVSLVPAVETANKSLLPVVVWIHGGGFVQGYKSEDGNGAGLISRAVEMGGEGLVFIAINYRLGLFGWLSSGTNTSAQTITPNVGLHDQLTALRWVRDYAHLFGGDADRITILSESAGAGSALIHLAKLLASDGQHAPLFQRAILQSPYTGLSPSSRTQTATYRAVLQAANVSSFQELGRRDSRTLQDVNQAVIAPSPYGSFAFAPVLDQATFPFPLAEISTKHTRKVVATNSKEGLIFTAPNVQSEQSYMSAVASLVPEFPPDALARLLSSLYPTASYSNQFERLETTLSDLLIRCTAEYTLSAFAETSHAYQYSVPSGSHGADLHYTFFDGDVEDLPEHNLTVALALQGYLASFRLGGAPEAGVDGVSGLPVYGQGVGVDLNITGITEEATTWLDKNKCQGLRDILDGAFA
ncbi:Alpha/Beta hydrolase protein [Diplogelasinospora grovesii]|uniref:Alpha/Beta hydrolase protein n=1 Tax=Diplogelasinospora grovesii TaxID=303347 RepID=A0AAN6N6K3_9PEZI|nr:Alpha/Beta hydrolase protein [Diplogelasinospora grovesii]